MYHCFMHPVIDNSSLKVNLAIDSCKKYVCSSRYSKQAMEQGFPEQALVHLLLLHHHW